LPLIPAHSTPWYSEGLTPAVVSDLLNVVYEGVFGVDEEDVLGLQVGVSQLVVMENCRGDRARGRGERAHGDLSGANALIWWCFSADLFSQ